MRDLAPYLDEIREEIRHLCSLRFRREELEYLRGLRFLKSDFVDLLRLFQLDEGFIDIQQRQTRKARSTSRSAGPGCTRSSSRCRCWRS